MPKEEAEAERRAAETRPETGLAWRVKRRVFTYPVETVKLDDDEAYYFQETAWNCWLETQKRLRQSGVDARSPFARSNVDSHREIAQ